MDDPYSIILYPLRTEKGAFVQEKQNKYTFIVGMSANKIQIKQALKEIYNVEVKDVNTMVVLGKKRRVRRALGKRPDWKKAVVTLQSGESIELK